MTEAAQAPASSNVAQTSEERVRQLRRRLLDLRTGNRLVHFPHSDRARNYVRVIDEVPELLFKKLDDGKRLCVLPLPEAPTQPEGPPSKPEELARARGLDPSFELPRPSLAQTSDGEARREQPVRRHADDAIQTLLTFEQHQKTLLKLAESTRSMQEEQGIPTLFAACGFLEWYEQADSDVARFSPLVLLPLSLERERKLAAYDYYVSAPDAEPSINLTLAERLRIDFNVQLPAWLDEDELGAYLYRLAPTLAAMPRWKLHRWVTLSNFSFARMAMYHDLAAERWPAGQTPAEHKTFRSLTSDRTSEQAPAIEHDAEQLGQLADELSSLILDADTSQVAAILEAFKDRNLVIKGPPGTGKSQTIANLIATALQNKQRVLFVAEKMAALEVVKARLDGAGLGAFCLELHSHRATRKAVMESIAARLELSNQAAPEHESERKRARALRTRLNEYAAALNAPCGSLGLSVHDLIWRREAARREIEPYLPALEPLRLSGATELSLAELDSVHHTLRGFQHASRDQSSTFAADPDSIWRAVDRVELDEAAIVEQLERYEAAVALLRSSVRGLLGPVSESNLSVQQLWRLHAWSGTVAASRALVSPTLSMLEPPEARKGLVGALQLIRLHHGLTAELERDCRDVSAARLALEPLKNAAKGLVTYPTEATLTELHSGALALTETCEQLRTHAEGVARLLEFAGLKSPHDAETVLAFREALELLEQAPRELLHALCTSPALLDETSPAKLQRLHDEAKPLLARRTELDARIVRVQHERELSEHGADLALALQRPWWLAWLFSLYWKARALHRRVAVRPGSNTAAMASDLLEASRLLHELETYGARDDARQLLAGSFAGVDTDFDLLSRAAAWARKVTTQFTRLHPAYRSLKALLLSSEPEHLATLLTEAALLPLAPLWELATRAQRTRMTLADALESERKLAAQTLLHVREFERVGARPELTVGDFSRLLARLDELLRVEHQLVGARTTLQRLELHDEPLELDLDALEDTLRAAEWAATDDVPLSALVAIAAPELRASFVQELTPLLAREAQARDQLDAAGLPKSAWQALAAPLPHALDALAHAIVTRHLLRAQLRYLRERERACATFAGTVVKLSASGALPLDKLLSGCDFVLYHALISHACEGSPGLAQGNGSELESVRTQFRELDREILKLNASCIASELSRALPPEGIASGKKSEWSELALIKHELTKRMRHVPLRQLMQRAGTALSVLKPCFMMSPLSVAQFLPQLVNQFDLVVIDEASQMRPEDAVGAIVRGRRAVVVGDPKQLPPTAFFQRIEKVDDELDNSDTGDEEKDEPVDAESILDLGLASFGATTDLRWHYRSRHPSLIAFSNEHFYDGRLKVFPAPHEDRSEFGVELVRVAGEYAASTNAIEALRIAERVQHHVHHRPHLSLGVAAMNQKQKDLILEQIARLDDERVRAFVDSEQTKSAQPFFVKSLENVQGDERDVIFVSLTYGPEPRSKRVFQRFGPLNSAHGARRLNVLLTRAREQLVVFS
ncbi:MAG: transcription elongation factor GreA/GreB domain protein, partial [Myxococcaceae bacterium]|nr:transcription elongation factor GreA/GreB domain protein [Myxococcaceae bacterium]